MENKELILEIYKKLDILDMRVDSIDKTMIKQEINLADHMKRSDALEAMMSQLRKDMRPIEKHVLMIEGVIKFLGILSIGLSVIGGLLKLFGAL